MALRRTLQRLFLFVAFFATGTALHFFFRPEVAPFVNGIMNARVSGSVINALTPGIEPVRVRGSVLATRGHRLQVSQGCEGVDVMLMLVGALLATPMHWRRKLWGMLAGTLLIYGCNVLRITGLWFTLLHWPDAFETMHILVGQTVIILAAVTFFIGWTRNSEPSPE